MYKFREYIEVQKKRTRLLCEVKKKDEELDVDKDTYSMAFNALNYESMKKMELNPSDVHGAFQAAL